MTPLNTEREEKRLIVLVGPTATGKTAAAVELAERIDGEILNADSMQVYLGMDIGTAKPTAEERRRVPFHLLDLVHPDQPFSVAEWKEQAEAAISHIQERNRIPIVCGGTGLYVRALLDGWSLAGVPANETVRSRLRAELEAVGAPTLHRRLGEIDPETADRLHPNDGVRIVRALEVYTVTGQPISVYQAWDRAHRTARPAMRIGLTLPRPTLYERIDRRVDQMVAAGWEAEVRALLQQGYNPQLSPLQGLGYKEMLSYLHGDMELSLAIETIKQNTRRFAKRQQTWFRADHQIVWIDVSALSSAEVASYIIAQTDASE